jgi:DNA-binding winged helix-turn-helix (wHTH) protein
VRVRFGEFALDLDTRQLHRGATDVHLSTKAFDLLKLLIGARPRVLSKGELQEALWPGIFVSEANLFTLISEIRAAIEDDARRPGFVRTVHGVGYAFSGEATELAASQPIQAGHAQVTSRFFMISGTRSIALGEGENVLGRDTDIAVYLDSAAVSRRHARIVVAGLKAVLEDLGSKNGTYLNNQRVESPVPLSDGDQIRIGSVLCTFRAVRPGMSTETQEA